MKSNRFSTHAAMHIAIPALVLIAYAVRVVFLGAEGLWRDEVDAIRFAMDPLPTVLGRFREPEFNGALYHLVLRGWLQLAGVNDFALRYLSVAFGVLLTPMVFATARRLGGGIAAAALTAISPILVWYAGEGKMYSMQPFTLTLAIYALLRAMGAPGSTSTRTALRWWLVFAAATIASLSVHILSPLFLVVAAVTMLIRVPHWGRRQLLMLGAFALPLIVLAPRAAALAEQFLAGRDFGHTRYGLDMIAQTLAANWVLGLDGSAPWFGTDAPETLTQLIRWTMIAAVLMLAAFGAFAGRNWKNAAVLAAWLLLPSALLYMVSLRVPLFQPRYVLWCAPALYILADLGLRRLGALDSAKSAVQTITVVIVVTFAGGIFNQWQNPIRPQVREAVQHIGRALQPGDAVMLQIPYIVHSWNYYMRSDPNAATTATIEGPYTNAGMTEADVGAQLEGLQDIHTRLWLLESEAEMWDQHGLTRAWLDANWRLLERVEMRGAAISLYTAK